MLRRWNSISDYRRSLVLEYASLVSMIVRPETKNAFATEQAKIACAVIVRKKMEDAVKRNGGEYRGDLTKEVTHLIAHKPTGKKYSFAKEWGIRVVSIEWLQQSIERGMVLDENLYDPLLAPVERGREAWVRRVVTESSIKRPRDDELIPAPVRKLRRTASARFSREGAGIWTDIAESVSGPKDSRQNEWDEHENERATSRASDVTQHKITTSKTQRVAIDHASQTSSPLDALFVDGMQQHPAKHGLFSGKRFFLHGFDTQKVGNTFHISPREQLTFVLSGRCPGISLTFA